MTAAIDFDGPIAYPEEPILNGEEKALRDMFVREYLADFEYTAAAVRIGFNHEVAFEYGQRFRYDPYVRRRISEAMAADPHDEEAVGQQQQRKIVSQLFKESNYNGPGASHGARVSALSKLAAIHGLEAPAKTHATVKHEGGQEISVSHEFNFETLSQEERDLVRKLLEGRVDNGDQ